MPTAPLSEDEDTALGWSLSYTLQVEQFVST